MKYFVEMGSVCNDKHNNFHEDRFRHSKVDRVGHTYTQTGWRSHKPTLGF
jgi:hypothetical protein